MSQLRLTLQAEQDLLEPWMYIAEENPTAADSIVDAIYEKPGTWPGFFILK